MLGLNPIAPVEHWGEVLSASDRSRLSREQFMNILVAELTNQDPLEPLKNQEFLSQIVQLQNLEAVSALTDGITAMRQAQEIVSASALIGKVVRGISEDGVFAQGLVESVSIRDGVVRLVAGGRTFTMAGVKEILNPNPEN